MNENQWKIARDLASELHNSGTDVNEFGKVVALMRRYQKADDAIEQFRLLLDRLVNSNDAFSRSNKTPTYYLNIKEYCEKHLSEIKNVNDLMLVLGWCRRLMYYYKQEPKIIPFPLSEEKPKPKYIEGTTLKAKVLKKQVGKVTVELQTDDKQEIAFETRWFRENVGDEVNVKVTSVDDNGNIKEVVPA